ncbi:hypothetical protein CEXT_746921, partial [Caerostris extrusa]
MCRKFSSSTKRARVFGILFLTLHWCGISTCAAKTYGGRERG